MATLAQRVAQSDCTGLADWQVAALLNVPDAAHGTRDADVSARAVRAVLMGRGKWPAVLVASEAASRDATWASARLLYDFVAEGGTFNTSTAGMLAALTGQLSQLVTGNVIAEADKAAVLALVPQPISEAEANPTWGAVDARAVGIARGAR